MFGWGYAKDTCISLFQKEMAEKAVVIYCGECLRIMTENVAKLCGGSYVELKIQDILEPKPKDDRTAEDIIEGIRKKLK